MTPSRRLKFWFVAFKGGIYLGGGLCVKTSTKPRVEESSILGRSKDTFYEMTNTQHFFQSTFDHFQSCERLTCTTETRSLCHGSQSHSPPFEAVNHPSGHRNWVWRVCFNGCPLRMRSVYPELQRVRECINHDGQITYSPDRRRKNPLVASQPRLLILSRQGITGTAGLGRCRK